ncbi:NEK protein Kinase [Phytophthora palmivora]|uniref:non-specific serine/threonine protein kinase n=1 Tax=Phytophthora palmivora TaxID=4796 RepID=A0A2P4X8Y7_9STRA|nr:NEK protein Kinase [Phytophthora palmivora]
MAAQSLPTKSRDKYKQLAHIGRGAYGDVFLCENIENGEHVCMKVMDLTFSSPDERMRCLTEVKLLNEFPAHPNVVGFREAFWAESTEADAQILVLVLEYADDEDLEQYLRSNGSSPIREEEARQVFIQLVRGVNHLHSHRVMHRDLKCSNALRFRSGRVVLGDFGTSKLLTPTGSEHDFEVQGLTSTVVGSPLYMSPEQLEGEPYGFATDIWSLGCVLYEMLSGGKPPFGAPSYPAVVYRITQGEYDPLDTSRISPEARDLMANMLQKAPQSRPNITQVLQSTWLRTFGVTEVKNGKAQAQVSPHRVIDMDCQTKPAVPQELLVHESPTSVIHAAEKFPPPVPFTSPQVSKHMNTSVSKQNFSPPPVPVYRVSKSPICRVDRSQQKTTEAGRLHRRVPTSLLHVWVRGHHIDVNFANSSCSTCVIV